MHWLDRGVDDAAIRFKQEFDVDGTFWTGSWLIP